MMNSDLISEQNDRHLVSQLNNARYASLTSRAVTDPARGIIDRLMDILEGREEYRKTRKNKRSKKAQYAVRRAMEGFVGDLLRAQQDEESGGWVYRSLKANSFSGEAVSYRNFQVVLESLNNFVEQKTGYQERYNLFDPGGPSLPIRGKASRFRLAPHFIEYCGDYGVDVRDINDHFIQDLPQHPLVKKSRSTRAPWGAKVRGKTMKFERAGKAQQLEQQVRDLNEFLDRFDLRGGAHRGYVRIFNQGDHASFDWNKGGRLYSQGDNSYQRLKQDDRLRMTINGEEVCEVDIRASYLTIYHAHHGAPLDPERDPYELPDFPTEARNVVKLWFVATFGNNDHLERWPREIAANYREKHGQRIGKRYPVKRIREIAVQQYPLLENWGTEEFGWADLMFLESEAMLGAMIQLMSQGIPSLTVHDSLIVPVSKRDIAQEVLKDHYRQQTGAWPVLNLEYPLPAEPAMRDDLVFTDADFGDGKDDDQRFANEEEGVYTAQEDDDPYGFADREEDDHELASQNGDGADNNHATGRQQQDWSSDSEEDAEGEDRYRHSSQTEADSNDDYNDYDSSQYF
jgi:hypothetical protein